jgi:hypothetical protein
MSECKIITSTIHTLLNSIEVDPYYIYSVAGMVVNPYLLGLYQPRC